MNRKPYRITVTAFREWSDGREKTHQAVTLSGVLLCADEDDARLFGIDLCSCLEDGGSFRATWAAVPMVGGAS